MKKTYIKPENTVAIIDVEKMIAQSTTEVPQSITDYDPSTSGEIQAREIIQSRDAWEEW